MNCSLHLKLTALRKNDKKKKKKTTTKTEEMTQKGTKTMNELAVELRQACRFRASGCLTDCQGVTCSGSGCKGSERSQGFASFHGHKSPSCRRPSYYKSSISVAWRLVPDAHRTRKVEVNTTQRSSKAQQTIYRRMREITRKKLSKLAN